MECFGHSFRDKKMLGIVGKWNIANAAILLLEVERWKRRDMKKKKSGKVARRLEYYLFVFIFQDLKVIKLLLYRST